jgi:hypothetical protein
MADTNLHKLLVLVAGLAAAVVLLVLLFGVFAGRLPTHGSRTSPPARVAEPGSSARVGLGSGQRFEIVARAVDRLLPGGPEVPVDLLFANRGSASMTVHGVTMRVTGVSVAGCDAAGIVVTRQLAATPVVPARSQRSLGQLGVPRSRWPRLRMLERGNQDACEGATVALALSGSATSP